MAGKETLERFIEECPIAVMTRAIIHQMIDKSAFDKIFDENRSRQYDGTIKFSALALAMSEIALGTKRNRNQAYKKHRENIGASSTAFYTKLNRTEPKISEAIVEYSAEQASQLLEELNFEPWEVVPGYNCFSIDGNHLQKTEKRLSETSLLCAAALPGTVVARFNHQSSLFEKAYLLEDAHAQEATVLDRVVEDLKDKDLVMADRHFCIQHFCFSVADKQACFVIRQKRSLKGELIGDRKYVRRSETGQVYEQAIKLSHGKRELIARRITVELDEPTREGDTEIHLLSNVPASDASGRVIAESYLRRWEIENAFHSLTMTFRCENSANCYPRCALLQFCMAMFAYNARRVLFAALYSEHNAEEVDQMSEYQVSVDTLEPMAGMFVAITESEWNAVVPSDAEELCPLLRRIAKSVDVKSYRASVRGPKKPPPKRKRCKAGTHVSTHRLLQQRNKRC